MSQQPFDLSSVPRDSRRVPIATSVTFKFERFSGFISEYSANISPTGMFITAKSPEPPGSVLDFEFRLGDGFELIQGKGEVVWTRVVPEGPHRPAGMGIRFLELSEGSKELIYRIVDQYIQDGGIPFDVSLRPPDPVQPQPYAEPDAPFPDLPDSGSLPPVDSSSWLPPLSDDGLDLGPAPKQGDRDDMDDDFPPFMPPLPPMDEPETGRPSLSFSALPASAPAPPKRRVLPLALLGLLLALAVAAVLFREPLMEMAGFGGGEPEIATGNAGDVAQAPAAPEVVEEEPAAPLPEVVHRKAPEEAPAPVPVAPVPVAEETPAPAPSGPAVTVVQRITFEQAGGGTDVILWGNGAIRPEVYEQSRIGDPPRELIRLVGISRPYPSTKVAVGTGEVRQIRTGYHEKSAGNELHIVIDLADPAVKITGFEARENHLRIRLRRP